MRIISVPLPAFPWGVLEDVCVCARARAIVTLLSLNGNYHVDEWTEGFFTILCLVDISLASPPDMDLFTEYKYLLSLDPKRQSLGKNG